MIATSPIKIRLTRLRPCCRPGGAWSRSMKATDSPDIAEIHPDEKRSSDHVPIGHKAPEAAVLAVIPIVAHHEVAFRRHGARDAARTVDASFRSEERRVGKEWRSRMS